MKKHIPNLFTCLNLFSGCVACVMAFHGNYGWVVFFVVTGSIFDFFDGFLARILNAPSAIGKELDSLADMVTFGVAPSLILFYYLKDNVADTIFEPVQTILPYFAFLLAVFSALRLAKFNIDTRQASSFIGVPTPANALFWISLCYGLNEYIVAGNIEIIILLVLIVIFSLLMTSEIPMFSLKIKQFKIKGNEKQLILILFTVVSVAVFKITGIAISILFYILLSIITTRKHKNEQI